MYKVDGEVFGKVFTGSSSQAKQRRATSASGGVHCTRASGDFIAKASGGVPCTRASGILYGNASGGVNCTRASGVSRASVPSRDADRVSWSRTSGWSPRRVGGHALWLRKKAARRGYAWRRQQRARQLSSSRAACVPPHGTRLQEQASRWNASGAGNEREEDECEWQGFW